MPKASKEEQINQEQNSENQGNTEMEEEKENESSDNDKKENEKIELNIKVDEEKIKYRKINLIYKTKENGKQKIFGEEFVKN